MGRKVRLGKDRRKEYDLFISHSWDHDDEYERMEELLEDASYFEFKNYSIPEEKEIDESTTYELKKALRDQMAQASVILVLAGQYVRDSTWIKKEIKMASEDDKPIIGVVPWGEGEDKTPVYVDIMSDELVGWNTDSVVEAIRDQSP